MTLQVSYDKLEAASGTRLQHLAIYSYKKMHKIIKSCQSRFKILPNDYQRTFKHHQIWMLCMQTLESLFIWESCGHSKQKHQSKGTKSWKWAYMYYPELIQLVKYITYSLWGRLRTSNLFYLGRSNDCWLARSWCRVSYPRTIYSQFNLYNQIFGWSWIVCNCGFHICH